MADNPEAQIPLWFVSHAWLEPIHLFLTCLRRHSTLRELRVPAYWVCAYANNQHALEEAISNNPRKTSFYKAMRLCRGVLLVLDTQAIGWRLLRQHFAAKVFFVFHPRWKLYCTGLRALSQATLQEWGWPPAPMAPESCLQPLTSVGPGCGSVTIAQQQQRRHHLRGFGVALRNRLQPGAQFVSLSILSCEFFDCEILRTSQKFQVSIFKCYG